MAVAFKPFGHVSCERGVVLFSGGIVVYTCMGTAASWHPISDSEGFYIEKYIFASDINLKL